jgi:hypothetical protein
MSIHPHPTPPAGWEPQPEQPKDRRARKVLIGLGAGLVLVFGTAVVVGQTSGHADPPKPTQTTSRYTQPYIDPNGQVPNDPFQNGGDDTSGVDPTVYDKPEVSDFELTVRETSREHFGSAGDIVGYKLKLSVDKSKTFDPDKTYDLKYQVNGDEDGPSTETIEVMGDTYEVPSEDHISTYTNGKVRVKILSIVEA